MSDTPKPSLKEVLADRGQQYGAFSRHASISQSLMQICRDNLMANPQFLALDAPAQDTILEGLQMIQHKIARIVNGNPLHEDSWVDIKGYAQISYDYASGEKS